MSVLATLARRARGGAEGPACSLHEGCGVCGSKYLWAFVPTDMTDEPVVEVGELHCSCCEPPQEAVDARGGDVVAMMVLGGQTEH